MFYYYLFICILLEYLLYHIGILYFFIFFKKKKQFFVTSIIILSKVSLSLSHLLVTWFMISALIHLALLRLKEYIDILKSRRARAAGLGGTLRGIDVAKKQEACRGGRDLWRGHGFYWREQASNLLSLSKPHPRFAVRKSYHAGKQKTNDHSQRASCWILQKAREFSDIERIKSKFVEILFFLIRGCIFLRVALNEIILSCHH